LPTKSFKGELEKHQISNGFVNFFSQAKEQSPMVRAFDFSGQELNILLRPVVYVFYRNHECLYIGIGGNVASNHGCAGYHAC
jgi:hypothetical protein